MTSRLSARRACAPRSASACAWRQGGTRTGPIPDDMLRDLGLFELRESLKRQTGIEPTFMFYESEEALSIRGPYRLFPTD